MLVLAGLGEVVVPGDLPSLVTQLEKMIICEDPQEKLFLTKPTLSTVNLSFLPSHRHSKRLLNLPRNSIPCFAERFNLILPTA